MPAFLWALGGLLLNLVGSVVGRAMVALGLAFVTYQGFDVAIDFLMAKIKENMSALPVDIIKFLAFLWVDKAIGMVFSAYAAAVAIRMAGSGTITKMVTKG